MSVESVVSSNHLILCHCLLLLPSIFPSIRVFQMLREESWAKDKELEQLQSGWVTFLTLLWQTFSK